MSIKYPLATPTWDEADKNAAKAVIDSEMCTMGSITKKFEAEFAKFVNKKYCVFSNSGSSANLLAISALLYKNKNKYERGDEIIVPAVSWATTYYPIHQCGLKMIFVDVDLNTLNIDCDKIEKAITGKTKAIFAVNLLGNPCDYTRITNLCKEYNLDLIIDNCESMGSRFNDIEAGSIGLMGTYSTFFSHHMCTIEGGMTVTDNEELYQIMLSLRAHGWTRNLPDKNFVHDKDGEPFNDLFRFVLPGYNLRPNEIFAALGLTQLQKLPKFIYERILNHVYLQQELANYPLIKKNIIFQQYDYETTKPSWFGFSMILDNELKGRRKEIVTELMANGIECRPIVAGDFTKNPVIKWMDYEIRGTIENAQRIDRDGLFIGNNPGNLKPQIEHFLITLNNAIRKIIND